MTPNEDIDCEGDDDGKQPLHDDGGDEQIVPGRIADRALRSLFVEIGLFALLLGWGHAVGGRTEAAKQGVDGERDDAENRNFAEGIEASKVDGDNVKDRKST